MSDEPFDFARYFARVQATRVWAGMQLGMADFAALDPGQRVLDLGTGPGRLIQDLRRRGYRAIGVDAEWQVAARFRELHAGLPFCLAQGERLPFPGDCFDGALAGNVLFFLPDPLRALREMARVTRPDGWVVNWSPSETMSEAAMSAFVAGRDDLESFEKTHLVNWSRVAEAHRRWGPRQLAGLFADAGLHDFATVPVLEGLARYARGRKTASSGLPGGDQGSGYRSPG